MHQEKQARKDFRLRGGFRNGECGWLQFIKVPRVTMSMLRTCDSRPTNVGEWPVTTGPRGVGESGTALGNGPNPGLLLVSSAFKRCRGRPAQSACYRTSTNYSVQRTAIHRFPINLLLRVYLRRQTGPLGYLRARGIYGACIYGACREVLLGLLLRTLIWLRIQFLSCIHCNVRVLLVHCSIDFKELQSCHSTSIL